MKAPPLPLVLLFGPSGVGKTTLAEHLSKVLNWLHLDADPSPPDQSRISQLRNFGGALRAAGGLAALAGDFCERAAAAGSHGVVQSLGSTVYLASEQMAAARSAGLSMIYLSGEHEQCLQSFLSREAASGRNLDAQHWRKHNSAILQHLNEPACKPHRVEAFSGGQRRSLAELVAEVQFRCVTNLHQHVGC